MSKKDDSPRVIQRKKFSNEFNIRELEWTENQRKIVECILNKDSKIIFVAACAGTGKSTISTYCGLKLILQKKLSDYIYIRNPIESSDSGNLGFLPGQIGEKFAPYCQILNERALELISNASLDSLFNDERIHFTPLAYSRGASWAAKYIHVEEANNLTYSDFKLLLTRYASFSKMVIVGDFQQTDLPPKKQGAFQKMFELFDNEESKNNGIFCHKLGKEDIKRSGITSFLIDKLEGNYEKEGDWKPSLNQ
jgi:predicted ribonuclease YlaK